MTVTVVEHPLVAHQLAILRDVETPSWLFRQAVSSLATIVGVAACASLRTEPRPVRTPVSQTVGHEVAQPGPLLVPILRAGLAMLDSFLTLIPVSEVGFFGTKRDEATLLPSVYMNRMPENLTGRQVIVMDPMLATGGSLLTTLESLHSRGATDVTCVALVASPEGVAAVSAAFARFGGSHSLFLAVIDDGLNDQGYIVPGLGDAGDRLFGAY
ncbi:MAG: uracil phosphoribosyltransferase [Microbacteriaceae bacterium]